MSEDLQAKQEQQEALADGARRLSALIQKAFAEGWKVKGYNEKGQRTAPAAEPGLLQYNPSYILEMGATSAILMNRGFLQALFPDNWQAVEQQVLERPTDTEKILLLDELLTDQEMTEPAEIEQPTE